MSILDKLDRAAEKKERERAKKEIEELLIFLKNYEINGLDEIISEIWEITESGDYKKLIDAFRTEAYAEGKRAFTLEELSHVRVLKLARENLHFGGLLNSVFTPSFVTAKQISTIFLMIDYTYVTFSGSTTNWNDILNIYFSRLDERIIFALDQFDQLKLNELSEPTKEYFQKLKKLKWKDKNAKKLYDKINEFMFEIKRLVKNYPDLIEQAGWITTYKVTEDLFIQTLAGCNAANDNRYEVKAEDVIIAYKTFFKLIKTDVTKYKAIPELVQGIEGYKSKSGGYLICQKCGGYYQLEPGESMDDFECLCNCGGRLEYKTTLED